MTPMIMVVSKLYGCSMLAFWLTTFFGEQRCNNFGFTISSQLVREFEIYPSTPLMLITGNGRDSRGHRKVICQSHRFHSLLHEERRNQWLHTSLSWWKPKQSLRSTGQDHHIKGEKLQAICLRPIVVVSSELQMHTLEMVRNTQVKNYD